MDARALPLGSLAIAAACGGSTGGTFTGSDGGSSSSGGGSGGSSSGGGCAGSSQIECTVCGTTSLETGQCVNGTWMCPNLPVHCAGPDDAGTVSGSDAGVGDAGSQLDASFPCTACDPQTNFCEISYGPPPNDGGVTIPGDYCTPFECDGAAPACACATIGPFCTCTESYGAVTVTCPFHP
jgi:hypothetical protein